MLVSCAIVWIWLMVSASGQSQESANDQAPGLPLSSAIHAQDWEERRQAFDALMGLQETPATADRRRQLLFELLIVENEMVAAANTRLLQRVAAGLPPEEGLTEEYTEHYASVIAAVATLDDPRSARALAGAISTGWMAIGSLIAFGTVAVEPVAQRITEANPSVRSTVAYVLSEMLARSDEIANDAASRSIIKKVLIMASRDREDQVRTRSVTGLVRLGDPESIAIVENLARNDPYVDTLPGREGTYPVREAAEQALRSR
jgi:hypothetical protein